MQNSATGKFLPRLTIQTLLIMRMLTVFILAASLQVHANVSAQTVTYSVKNAAIEKVFKEIKRQTGYGFMYNSRILETAKPVTIEANKTDLKQVLDACFKNQPFTYELNDKTVIVKERVELPKKELGMALPFIEPVLIDVRGRVVNEKGEPLAGISVLVKGTKRGTSTDENGVFELKGLNEDVVLQISGVNIEAYETKLNGRTELNFTAKAKVSQLSDVTVLANTGYEQTTVERINGAVETVNNSLFNRRVGPNVLSRLNGVVNGMYFANQSNGNSGLGITIRGQTTLSSFTSKDPLIVLDNFPFDGDINSINPNDVENITVLKDAAAASVWGARAGNGVIVVTTKNGRLNQKLKIGFSLNTTVGEKPDIFYDQRFTNSGNYIGIEKVLFDNGYYNTSINNTTDYPGLSPAVEIFQKLKSGLISSQEANTQLAVLQAKDVRGDYQKYIYQKSISQQYAVNFSGGAQNISYYVGLGYDKSNDNLVRNGSDRFSLTANNTYLPVKGLQIKTQINYTSGTIQNNNALSWGSSLQGLNSGQLNSYYSLVDDNGNPAVIVNNHRLNYTDSLEKLGFLDWKYRPLDEINLSNNSTKNENIVLSLSGRYQINSWLNIDLQYQNQRSRSINNIIYNQNSFFARNKINSFTQYNATTKAFVYQLPMGAIRYNSLSTSMSNNYRSQLSFNKKFHDHQIRGFATFEIREIKSEGDLNRISYGYSEENGTSQNQLDFYNQLPQTGSTSGGFITAPAGNLQGTTQRNISEILNAYYAYKDRYSISASARRDGANLFGVRANDRITPLWSIGLGWDMSQEKFFKLSWLPYLKLRTSFGYNGNVYYGSAYLTASIVSGSAATGFPYGVISSAPNSELQWEKVKNINLGVDFKLHNEIITGSVDVYKKNGEGLIDNIQLAPSTGFTTVLGNVARTTVSGVEVRLNSKNLTGHLDWTTNLLVSFQKDKVVQFADLRSAAQLAQSGSGTAVQDYPVRGLYSFKFNGIDPATGDPIGYLDNKASKDYTNIINNAKLDNGLVYSGSTRPQVFGSLRNMLSYKGFSLSASISFAFQYVFRRPTIDLNYQKILSASTAMGDYDKRWQKPGDELLNTVPSMTYLTNANRSSLYQYADINIEKADNVRFQDVSIGYEFAKIKNSPFSGLQLYFYVNNVGLLWKANKSGYDPDAVLNTSGGPAYLPNPVTYSFSIRTNF